MTHPVYAIVAVRDQFTCIRCGRRGWDLAHILPRGRYPELKHEEKNICVLCRDCHRETENVDGRRELLDIMQAKYQYTYEEEQYSGYLE
jgi:hypothetical protein